MHLIVLKHNVPGIMLSGPQTVEPKREQEAQLLYNITRDEAVENVWISF